MSPMVLLSAALCTVALAWSVLLHRRRPGWRVGALAVVIALFLAHLLLGVLSDGLSWRLPLMDHLVQLPAVAIGVLAVATTIGMYRHAVRVGRVTARVPLAELHWRALIENALDRDLIAVLDADGRLQYVSPSVERLLGFRPEDLLGHSVFARVHVDDRARVESAFAAGLERSGPASAIELRFQHKDGSWRWLEAMGNNLLEDPDLQCVVVSCRDVTERRDREEEVRTRWDQARQFLDVAEVMFVALDEHGDITLVNRKGLSLLGYSSERELLGSNWFETCIPQAEAAAVMRVFRQCMAGETDVAGYHENLVCTKSGSERLVAWHNAVIRDQAGTPLGTLSAGEDITDRKGIEQELRKFRLGIEKSSEVVFLTDVDGRIVYANPAFERVYGYRPEEVIGQTPRILKSGVMSAAAYEEFWKALLSKQVVTGELVNRTKHGQMITVETSVSPVPGDDGSIVGFLAMQRDVTMRKETEKALRRSEAGYRDLIHHAVYGIYRSTPDGRFVAVNPALVQMLGYESAEALMAVDIAKDVYADRELRGHMLERYGEREQISGVEVEWKKKDGTRLTVRLSGRSVPGERGQIQYYEMLVEDVTERRALEQQLRHAQKLEAIGQLTAGIAHDFNNILTTIMANAELAAAAVPAGQVQLHSDINEITGAARRAADMIKKLMAFGRREHLDLEALELGQLVKETGSMLRRILPANIRIDVAVEDEPYTVHGNRGAIEQILLNLAGNARDAMPQGGELRLAVGFFRIDAEYRRQHGWGKPGPYVLLSVSDTGSGMDARTQARVFEPFFTTKPVGRGTGLGLSMVYGLVKQHGGFIDVYSEVGLGTTFNLYFPLASAAELVPVEAQRTDLPHGDETILVVEDEEAIRRSTQRILERYGYRVLVAQDGQQAAEFLRQHGDDIDLVVTDLVMPRLGGRQLYEETRNSGATARFLFTSGYAPSEVMERDDPGPQPLFLRKPWSTSDLVLRVREALDRAS